MVESRFVIMEVRDKIGKIPRHHGHIILAEHSECKFLTNLGFSYFTKVWLEHKCTKHNLLIYCTLYEPQWCVISPQFHHWYKYLSDIEGFSLTYQVQITHNGKARVGKSHKLVEKNFIYLYYSL